MNKIGLVCIGVLVLAGLFAPKICLAKGTQPLQGVVEPSQGVVEPLHGVMIGGGVHEGPAGASANVGSRYWDRYVGIDVFSGLQKSRLSIGGSDIVNSLGFGFAMNGLLGFDVNKNAKPFFGLGLSYSYYRNRVADYRISELYLVPNIGVDFRASNHIILGLDLMSLLFNVAGNSESKGNSVDIDVSNVSLLSGFRVAYLF